MIRRLVEESLAGQLANFKVSNRCAVVDELARNTLGKVQKKVLRARVQQVG